MKKLLKKIKKMIVISLFPPLLGGVLIISVCAFQQNKLMAVYNGNETAINEANATGTYVISPQVETFRSKILEYAETYGISDYIDLLLAIVMQESGGNGTDIFQCAESLSTDASLLTVEESIEQGVKLVSKYLTDCGVESPDEIDKIKIVLQAYNFGSAYIDWVEDNGGEWSQDNVDSFAKKHSNEKERNYIQAERLGKWAYGDQYYTQHVLRYYKRSTTSVADSDVVNLAQQQLGKPYEWGATGPDSFDCSGLVYYVYKETGKYTGGRMTASGYKNLCLIITKEELQPGDLVFYSNRTGVHHVAIYIEGDTVIHAPKPGDVVKTSTISNAGVIGDVIYYGRLEN